MRILIRADGDHRIGTGHILRMLALAQHAMAAGHAIVLVSARLDAPLEARMRHAGVIVAGGHVEPGSLEDRRWTVDQAAAHGADWVVLDGYRFDAPFQDAVRSAGFRTLLVDDYGGGERYAAHIVLNQNVFAASGLYRRRVDETQLLLGPEYALLRKEFVAIAAAAPAIAARADRMLVTLGGADPVNATERILDALARVTDEEICVRVVVGPSNPLGPRLAARASDRRIEVLPAVEDMAALMAWADLAIAAAGATVYELCCLGVPTLVVAIAEPQQVLARALDRECLAIDLGWHEALEPAAVAAAIDDVRHDRTQRAELSRRSRERVDGRGAARVVEALASMPGG